MTPFRPADAVIDALPASAPCFSRASSMILAHVSSLSAGWISSFGVFRGRPCGPGAECRWGRCSAHAGRHRVRNGGHHHPRPSRHRPFPLAVHGIHNTVLQPYPFNLRVVRPATWKVKRNDGGRVNIPEKRIESVVPRFPSAPRRWITATPPPVFRGRAICRARRKRYQGEKGTRYLFSYSPSTDVDYDRH